VRQVLAETSILALLAAALGTSLSYFFTATLIASAPRGVPRLEETAVDPWVLGFALLAAILASLASGLIPAVAAAHAEIPALRGEHRAGGSRSQGRIRFALVSAEIALALTLLAGAGLLVRSAMEMGRVRPGFDPKGVLTARITLPADAYLEPERVVATFERIVSALSEIPGVRRAAVSSQVPMGPGGGSNGLIPEGKSFEDLVSSRLRMVTPEYFAGDGDSAHRGTALRGLGSARFRAGHGSERDPGPGRIPGRERDRKTHRLLRGRARRFQAEDRGRGRG
jgi:hypothetical protein